MQQGREETVKVSARISKSELERLAAEYQTASFTDILNKLIDEKLEHRFAADATRSVITGIGAKNRVAKKMISLMPEHSIYVEPFGNTASVLLQKEPVKVEVYNDKNGQITNFFRVLRQNPMGLYNACVALPYSEEQYRQLADSPIPDDPLQKAVRFFYLNRAGFLGSPGNGFRSGYTARNNAAFYYQECERFYAVSRRLQNVEIWNKDYRKVIRKYDHPDTFIMADPPYLDGTDYYEEPFTMEDHIMLADMMAGIKGKAMVCHSKHSEIKRLYLERGFRYETIRTKYWARKGRVVEGREAKEDVQLYLYMNY